uniref:Uncharacterized protein n=1 Tax=Meloidogyne javanica TaxID=6303 RepID=A0A915MF95_MELJA
MIATLLTISIGNSENKFAVFIDELNDVVYDYSKAALANLGERDIKEILNKEGALAMVGPDMNLNDEQIDANSIDIFYVSQTGCEATLDIELNGKRINERFDCYKRPRNLCDILGLEEFNKLSHAYDELKELRKTCPCHEEPRPSHIPDSWLYPNPKGRNKRSANVSLKLGESDEDELVNGCENAPPIAIGDLFLNHRQINELKEQQKKCCKNHSRNKRQLDSTSSEILWKMPIYYAFYDNMLQMWNNARS